MAFPNNGTISGSGVFNTDIINNNLIDVSQGVLEINGTLSSTLPNGGTVAIEATGTLQLDKAASGNNVSFKAGTGKLVIMNLGAIASTFDIVNINAGDVIALPNVPATFGMNYNAATGNLSIINAGTTLGHLFFTPNASITSTFLQNAVVKCFAAGTRIDTMDGPVPVEDLAVGDNLLNHRGEAKEVSWIGSREVNCQTHPRPETVWPVRVAADAFGPNVPGRDLYLSPDHAVFVNDVLVPVKLLANGTSIARVERESVTYYHIELDRHDVILAEGLPVESYLDIGDRANFDGGDIIRLFPDFASRLAPNAAHLWEAKAVAPLALAGPELAAARNAVATHAPSSAVKRSGRRRGRSTPPNR